MCWLASQGIALTGSETGGEANGFRSLRWFKGGLRHIKLGASKLAWWI